MFVIPGQLRQLAGGREEVRVPGGARSLAEALSSLWLECPAIRDRVLTELGDIRPHINIFVQGEDVRLRGGLHARVPDGAEIVILPAVSGGTGGSLFSVELIRDLYRHMTWADATLWNAVPDPTGGHCDDRLRTLLLHIHTVQRAFLYVWTEQAIVFPDPAEFPTLAAVRAWAQPYYERANAFIAALDDRRLDDPVALPWVRHFERKLGHASHTPTLGETLFQVTSHSTHHRAQVSTRLKELGTTPPLVDYIAWVWFGRPAPA